jgi:hypothetical protein
VPALRKIFGIFNGILESQKQQKYVFPAPKKALGAMEDAVRARRSTSAAATTLRALWDSCPALKGRTMARGELFDLRELRAPLSPPKSATRSPTKLSGARVWAQSFSTRPTNAQASCACHATKSLQN